MCDTAARHEKGTTVVIREISSANMVYKSAPIVERRERILREARLMISEAGFDNFSIRELARRADVAQKTLYNAFGSKDGIVSSAIGQYAQDLLDSLDLPDARPSLENALRRLIHLNVRNAEMRSYAVALMTIINSATVTGEMRASVRNLSREPNQKLGEALLLQGALAPFVTPEVFAARQASTIHASLTDWCLDEVGNADSVDWICEGYLIGYCGLTTGTAQRDGEMWLLALRSKARAWTNLVSEVEEGTTGKRRRKAVRKTA